MLKNFVTCLFVSVFANLPFLGQVADENIVAVTNARIREESARSSSIIKNVHILTDLYGPRMTGTPSLMAAQDWALTELTRYGLLNGHFEDWDFGFPGWRNEKLSVYAVSPFKDSLVAEVMAWTPSTVGTITAETFNLIPPQNPTSNELRNYLASVRDQVRGKIVLTGEHNLVTINFNPPKLRLSDEDLNRIFAPEKPRPGSSPTPTTAIKRLTALEVNDEIDRFLKSNRALVRVYDGREPHGVIRAIVNRTRDISKFLPTIILRNEDYGRITRVLADGLSVRLGINVKNKLYPAGKTQRNLLAQIPGTDKNSEVVMLGAHLDSHHLATGATDNAVGVAIVMEAVRILVAVGAKPRRTIRVGLWSGEEQGVLGSQAYVARHFGSAEDPKPDFNRFNGYFNLDTGTGRIRGMRVFGPDKAGEVLKQILAPFTEMGVVGAGTYTNRTRPGSDHAAFSVSGLPGIYIDQDPLDYGEFTWHTSLDTYERVYEPDAKQAAIVIASAVYHLAMRDELLPRFTKEQMPALNYFPSPVPTPRAINN